MGVLRLYPYQRVGVDFLHARKGRALLCDDMGLGKTPQIVRYLAEQPKTKPRLVICPAGLRNQWVREAWRFGNLRALLLTGNTPDASVAEMRRADLCITGYDTLHRWVRVLQDVGWGCIASDEAHRVSGLYAKRSNAWKELCEGVRRLIPTSGTMVTDRPAQLWNVLSTLWPDEFDSVFDYMQLYCEGDNENGRWKWRGARNLDHLRDRLLRLGFLRRTVGEVLTDLPPLRREVLALPLSDPAEYKRADADFIGWLASWDPAKALRAQRAEQFTRFSYMRGLASKLKLPAVMEWIDNFLDESPGKLIVFGAHREEFLDKLVNRYDGRCVRIVGGMTDRQRDESERLFQNEPSVRLLFGHYDAAGVGLNLTAANTVLHGELTWNPASHTQAEKRCVLAGQPVLTPTGWKPIERVSIGDWVIGMDGRPHYVTDKWGSVAKRRREPHIAEIQVRGWLDPIKLTQDHLVLCRRGWIRADEIRPGDRLLMPEPVEGTGLGSVPVDDDCRIKKSFVTPAIIRKGGRPKPKTEQKNGGLVPLPENIKLTNDAMFVFGYYLGDGHSKITSGKGLGSRHVSLAGHKDQKKTYLKRCASWLSSLGLNPVIYDSRDSKACELKAYSGELAFWLTKHFGRTLDEKTIPDWVFDTSKDLRESMLDGLLAGDGYKRKGREEIITASFVLAALYSRLVMSLGHKVCVTRNDSGGFWSVSFTRGVSQELIVSSVMIRSSRHGELVYDLTVDDSSSFVIGTAVVHNCHRIGTRQSVRSIYAVADGTIENKLVEIIDRKQRVTKKILDGKLAAAEAFYILDELTKALLLDSKQR